MKTSQNRVARQDLGAVETAEACAFRMLTRGTRLSEVSVLESAGAAPRLWTLHRLNFRCSHSVGRRSSAKSQADVQKLRRSHSRRSDMAGGGVLPVAGTHQFEGRITAYVVLASIVAASGGLLFGYDIGVTGGVTTHDGFLHQFFPEVIRSENAVKESSWCKFDSQLLQLFTSSLFLAGILGGIVAFQTTSRCGRVRTMLVGGVFFLLGAVLTASAVNVSMLVLGRLSLGLGVGFANQAVPLYLSEVAPARARGALNMMFQMATTIGIIGGQLINYGTLRIQPWGWRISLGIAGIPAVLLTLGSLLLPETPNSLVERGFVEKGRAVLQNLRGKGVDIEPELEDILHAVRKEANHVAPFTRIFSPEFRPELTWAILIPFFQQMTGINAVMFYATPLFDTVGFGKGAALYSAVITGGVNFAATFVSILTADRFGRRVLFLAGGIQMIISQIAIAAILAVGFGSGEEKLSPGAAAVIVIGICVYVAGFAWSWGPLGWLVPSEIQPLETRSSGQAITVAVNFLFSFIIGQAFLSMLCHLEYGIFIFFASWLVIMTVSVYFFLPETKGVPIEDMPEIWRSHWFWGRCVPASEEESKDDKAEDTAVPKVL